MRANFALEAAKAQYSAVGENFVYATTFTRAIDAQCFDGDQSVKAQRDALGRYNARSALRTVSRNAQAAELKSQSLRAEASRHALHRNAT